MKKNILKNLLLVTAASVLFTACSGGNEKTATASETPTSETPTSETPDAAVSDSADKKLTTIKVGATALPHAEILRQIVPDLNEKGINLEIIEFADYTLLNLAVNENEIDANFFQHTPFFQNYVEASGQNLVSMGVVHTEPVGIYSGKIEDYSELADGAVIGIPNDATNEARALFLLEKNGLITLKEGAGFNATPRDIVENPKNVTFSEVDAALLPRMLNEVDIAVINTNYALEANITPINGIIEEDIDSPYANILVVRDGEETNKELQELYSALVSEKVKNFINQQYNGAIIPAF